MSAFYDLNKTPRNILNQAIVRAIISENNGAWFDPSDLSTLFQDAAGTIPVTALEQPVGLWLDKSQGLELGPELVTNGDFSNGTAMWTTVAGTTISGGKLIATNATDAVRQTISGLVVGKTYKITFTIDSISSGRARCVFSGSTSPYFTQAGTYTIYQQSSSGDSTLYLGFGGVPMSGVFDNVSVREIKGNHATQSITASRPTLSARYNWLLNSAALSTQSVTTVAAPYTLSFTGTGSVTLSGSATGTLSGTGANNRVNLAFTPTTGTLTLTVTGSVTLAMLALGTLTTYQAITTATSYDSAGWNRYVRFDGIDDFMGLPYMGLYANGSASIVTARDALSQATDAYIISERSTSNVNQKYFPSRQLANAGNMDAYIVNDAGTVVVDTVGSAYGGASNAVIRSAVDSGNNIKLFKNGALAANDNYTRSGTLTLTNTTIGASVSTTTSNYANMKLYGLVITKSALSDSERRRVERLLAYNSGAQI